MPAVHQTDPCQWGQWTDQPTNTHTDDGQRFVSALDGHYGLDHWSFVVAVMALFWQKNV